MKFFIILFIFTVSCMENIYDPDIYTSRSLDLKWILFNDGTDQCYSVSSDEKCLKFGSASLQKEPNSICSSIDYYYTVNKFRCSGFESGETSLIMEVSSDEVWYGE